MERKRDMTRKILILGVILFVGAVFLYHRLSLEEDLTGRSSNQPKNTAPITSSTPIENVSAQTPTKPSSPTPLGQKTAKITAETSTTEPVVVLNSGNFEGFVKYCFAGESCTLGEAPRSLYSHFKALGNRQALDSLLSYMRRRLQEEDFRKAHGAELLSMLRDFYPANELDFQNAAYYNYAGQLEKSLALYLELEKKAAIDPQLRPAPKLNIANTYYDLRRFREALPYYQAALDESYPTEVMRFIEGRIEQIKKQN